MSTSFRRTLRALDADRGRLPSAVLVVGGLLFAGWAAWLMGSRVWLYRESKTARFEVDAVAHPVEPAVEGQIVLSKISLGRHVEAGEVLAELDAEPIRLEWAEHQARLVGCGAQISAIQRELGAEEEASSAAGGDALAAISVARAKLREAETSMDLAVREGKSLAALNEGGLVSGMDARRAESLVESRKAQTEALRHEARRTQLSHFVLGRERVAKMARLDLELTRTRGAILAETAAMRRLEYEIARRKVTASVAGELADVAPLPVGAHVKEGVRLAVIVPRGTVRVVAHFSPAVALGHVHAGQAARLRVDGFPWTEYGSVAARVTEVGSEPRDGLVRVELTPESHVRIPVEHGLTGVVEVQVERIAPLTLLLREIGQRYAEPVRSPKAAATVAGSGSP